MTVRGGRPPVADALGDIDVRVLMAVVDLPAPDTSTIAETVRCARSTVLLSLRRLRDAGLVAFEDHTRGTLRALVVEVPCPALLGGAG